MGWFKQLVSKFRRGVEQPVISFVHIPKTAGTSFIVLLDRFFHADAIFPHQLWREVNQLNPKENHRFKLFRGHFGGGGFKQLTTRPLEYLTILRDPLSLACSTYQYVKREQNTRVHDLLKKDGLSLEAFISHPDTKPLVTNRLIRNLSFDFVEDPAAQEVFLSAQTIEYLQQHLKPKPLPLADGDRLLRAEKLLNQCRWFGLVERFDESMQLLCFAMGWRPIGQSQRLNTSRGVELSEHAEEVLRSLNLEDLRLYQSAKMLFNNRYQQMLSQLEQLRSTADQSTDDLLDVHYQRQPQPLADELDFRFDQVLQGQQWHRREFLDQQQGYFRWTGPAAQASIDFWLEPREYVLKLRIINATSTAQLDQLQLSVNGHPLSWHCADQGVVRVIEAPCPANLIAPNGLFRLGLQVNDMISHRQAFGSDDDRLVGVAVHWIQLRHA